MAKYEIDKIVAIANICTKYGNHRKWLKLRQQLANLEKQKEELPLRKRNDARAPVNVKIQALEVALGDKRHGSLDFWWKTPTAPVYSPTEGSKVAVLSRHFVNVVNRHRNPMEFHRYIVDWLLGKISQGRGVEPVTGKGFIEKLKHHKFLQELLGPEKEQILLGLNRFLVKNPNFSAQPLNVIVTTNPSPEEIINMGKKILPMTKKFRKHLLLHISELGLIVNNEAR